MNAKFASRIMGLVGIGFGFAALTGCQTNVAGMTLPSGHYLQHPPQYFAPSPAFPLQKELAAMEAQTAAQSGVPGGQIQAPRPAPLVPPAQGGIIPPPQPAPNQ